MYCKGSVPSHVVTLRVLMYIVSDSTPASFCSLRNINNTTPVSFLDTSVDYGKYGSVKGMEMFLERARKIVLKDLSLLFR